MEIKAVEKIGNYTIHYDNEYGLAISSIDYKKLEVTAKEMFEKLGYEKSSYHWGDIEYTKEIYNEYKSINIVIYFDNALKHLEINSDEDITFRFGLEELKAINKQIEELGWDNE